ncbi:MAG: hypothetical protein R3Y08_04230 [Rikenellaceae bacterium]
MKSKLYIAAIALFAAACNPITTDVDLSNSFDKDNIVLKAYQDTPGSNQITLRMESVGITGFWDFVIGTKYSDECTFIFPYTGTHTFDFHSTTPYIVDGDVGNTEYIKASIEVEVTTMDTPLADAYYCLVGDDLGGKAWVFDGTLGDNGVWWAMVNGSNSGEVWWNAGGTAQGTPVDYEGKMYFDVDGGANYYYYASADTEPIKANFVFNSSYTTLSFPGEANLMGAYNEGQTSGATTYEIINLTEDQLYLFASTTDGNTGWVYVFKPVE